MSKKIMMERGREYTLRSLTGHTIRFERGVPIAVPPDVVQEAMEIGAFPVEDGLEVEAEVTNAVVVPPTGKDRADIIAAALGNMRIENNRGDFTASGFPQAKAVGKRVGFDVYANEIKKIWEK